uniref:Uncharacterized protein n=1 Tax=Anguilla anguilla TaxID=7936 RepID=A0A0E9WJH0_ANGAN
MSLRVTSFMTISRSLGTTAAEYTDQRMVGFSWIKIALFCAKKNSHFLSVARLRTFCVSYP